MSYKAHKKQAAERQAEQSKEGRDIGPIPPPAKQRNRKKAAGDFCFFCQHYFPATFALPFCADHRKAIARIEEAVIRGGLFALAMPRGAGKSSLCEAACLWAMLNGHRDFVVLIGATAAAAVEMLESIKGELESNDLLAADYPEALSPIHALERIANRCKGQLCQGQPTFVRWTQNEIILPTVSLPHWKTFRRPNNKQSLSSGAVVRVAGLTGRLRGLKAKRPDGFSLRPSLVVIDDPQTDESSGSLTQCEKRERILAGAVLGLAGPGKKISGIMPCTVIRPGDMADKILDRDKHPEWNGERTRMVYSFPANEKLWQQYGELRADSLRAGHDGEEATEFYRENRQAMDAGAVIAWAERFNHDELSAIQHAMNLKFQDEAAFMAEYQNEPLKPALETTLLTPDQIAAKVNRQARSSVPIGCNIVTAFIDVQATLLYYLVAAWEDNFTGYVLDYGTFPDQQRSYFSLANANPVLAQATGHSSLEASIFAGLEKLAAGVLARGWPRADNSLLRIERCLIDAGWGQVRDLIYRYCTQSAFPLVVLPSHGRFVGASSVPMAEYARKPGERLGTNWILRTAAGAKHVTYDTNYWKSFIHDRLAAPMGTAGCLSLFGDRPADHRLLADHLTAETKIKVEARGRTVEEWRLRPDRPDNHWFDCLVGSAIAASMLGASMLGPAPTGKQRVSFREMQQAKKRERER